MGARACVMLMAAAAGRGRAGQGAAVVAGAAGPGHEGVGAAAAHGRRWQPRVAMPRPRFTDVLSFILPHGLCKFLIKYIASKLFI